MFYITVLRIPGVTVQVSMSSRKKNHALNPLRTTSYINWLPWSECNREKSICHVFAGSMDILNTKIVDTKKIIAFSVFLPAAVTQFSYGCEHVCKCAFVPKCVMSCVLLHLITETSGNCNEGRAWSLCTSVFESMIACEGQGITDMSC